MKARLKSSGLDEKTLMFEENDDSSEVVRKISAYQCLSDKVFKASSNALLLRQKTHLK